MFPRIQKDMSHFYECTFLEFIVPTNNSSRTLYSEIFDTKITVQQNISASLKSLTNLLKGFVSFSSTNTLCNLCSCNCKFRTSTKVA